MTRFQTFPALFGLGLLAGCATHPVSATVPTIAVYPLDSALRRQCGDPVEIPPDIKSADIDRLWTRDRAALADCRDKDRVKTSQFDRERRALGGN